MTNPDPTPWMKAAVAPLAKRYTIIRDVQEELVASIAECYAADQEAEQQSEEARCTPNPTGECRAHPFCELNKPLVEKLLSQVREQNKEGIGMRLPKIDPYVLLAGGKNAVTEQQSAEDPWPRKEPPPVFKGCPLCNPGEKDRFHHLHPPQPKPQQSLRERHRTLVHLAVSVYGTPDRQSLEDVSRFAQTCLDELNNIGGAT